VAVATSSQTKQTAVVARRYRRRRHRDPLVLCLLTPGF
jgi:hypothetical protein